MATPAKSERAPDGGLTDFHKGLLEAKWSVMSWPDWKHALRTDADKAIIATFEAIAAAVVDKLDLPDMHRGHAELLGACIQRQLQARARDFEPGDG